MSSSLHHSQQRASVTKRHRDLSALRGVGPRPSNTQGYPLGRMRPPRGFKITCGQGIPPWVLLADCPGRGQRASSEVSRVSEVPLQATPAGFCTQDHSHSLALCCLGSGYGRTIQDGPRWHDSLACCCGEVHQVDRGKPIKNLNWPTAMTFIADITTRYGIPHRIIADNGTNFAKGALARFCAT